MQASANISPSSAVQRRDNYRLEVPSADEAACTFRFARKFERPAYAVRLEIYDISAEGLSVIDHDGLLTDCVGTTIRRCELKLPTHQRLLITDMKILRAQDEQQPGNRVASRVSCVFVNAPETARMAVRRYISNLERRHIARQRGLD